LVTFLGGRVAFNRLELAGAFGDIGTDLPLILGMVAINHLDPASVFIMFGVFQIFNGLRYGIPMPVQPLKAIAAIMIATKPDVSLLFGSGLSLGLMMLFLNVTGLVSKVDRWMPKGVVRGIQAGLGFSLMTIAVGYVQKDGLAGWVLAAAGVAFVLAMSRRGGFPTALVLVLAGALYAAFLGIDLGTISAGVGIHLPHFQVPTLDAVAQGTLLLSLQQLPLSIANSVIATSLLVSDLFPSRRDITSKSISATYAGMNLIAPFFGGIPVCHGCGGLAGHYRFGARTGGSVIIYGSIYVIIGLFFASVVNELLKIFPFSVLGVILLFEGLTLLLLLKKVASDSNDLTVALVVAFMVVALPYGYLLGMVAGSALHLLLKGEKVKLEQAQ
jgi:hypothetical protein